MNLPDRSDLKDMLLWALAATALMLAFGLVLDVLGVWLLARP
jgi:preprotein translocase subunit SecE